MNMEINYRAVYLLYTLILPYPRRVCVCVYSLEATSDAMLMGERQWCTTDS